MQEKRITENLLNGKTFSLPKFDPRKENLPKICDYEIPMDWLRAVRDVMGGSVVFALDEAMMCHGAFLGRVDEYLVWVYGEDSLTRFNGVIVLGNHISPRYVMNRNGLRYTDFNRTLYDALENESILDMQGITEALSWYYFSHNESFEGLFVSPEYQDRFEQLATDAIEYYDS